MKTWFLKNRTAITQAFFVALAGPVTLALTALSIYFANMMELPGNPGSVCAAVLIQVVIGVLLLFAIQLPFLGRKAFSRIAATLFTLGFLLWFQANVFNWDFGLLDGREIPWKSYTPLGIFELCVYCAIFFLIFRFKNKLLEQIIPISCILIVMQAVPVCLAVVQTWTQETVQAEQTEEQPEHNIFIPSWKQYSITFDDFFEFSQEENVVLVILDALGTKIFEDIQKKHPEEIGDIFRDFMCFDHAICDIPLTRYCIPQILTGCSTDELPGDFVNAIVQNRIFSRGGTLLKTLSENQYRCEVFCSPPTIYFDSRWISNIRFNDQQGNIADISELSVLTLFRTVPTLLKRVVLKNTLRRWLYVAPKSHDSFQPILARKAPDYEFNTWIQAASHNSFANRKTFKYIHLQGAHRPYTMDENCMKAAKSSGEQQALGALRITKNFLDLMKKSDVYDQSLIIVMSDHGPRRSEPDLRSEVSHDPSISLRPSFFIKRKHTEQPQMDYCGNPIHIRDTVPIILSELGILQDEEAFSPFEMPESLVEERKNQWESIWKHHK